MNIKRTISLALTLTMLLAISSCGNNGNIDNNNTDNSDDVSAALDSQTEITEYQKPDVNYGGEVITIASYDYDGAWKILDYNIALSEDTGDIINDAIVKRNRDVEEALNVKIELLPLDISQRNDTSKLRNFIMAAEDAFDFALQMECGLSTMVTTEGMLVDLKTVPTLDLTHSWWNQNANQEYTIYEKQLAAVGDICLFNIGAPIVVYFNKQMIEDNNLENPYELVKNGEWTIDKLFEMAMVGARDTNGNQTVDATDNFGFAGEMDSTAYFLSGCGIRMSQKDKSGEIKITVNNERTANVCEKFISFINDKSYSMLAQRYEKEFPSTHSSLFMPKLMNNELMFYTNQLLVSLNLREMNSDFGILPLPKYDTSQENYISVANTWFSDHLIIPSTNNDLEMTGNVIEAMGYGAKKYIVPAFIEQTVLGKAIRDEDSADNIQLILDTQIFDIAYMFDWGKVRSIFSSMCNGNQTNFTTQYAAIENNVKAALEKTLEDMK